MEKTRSQLHSQPSTEVQTIVQVNQERQGKAKNRRNSTYCNNADTAIVMLSTSLQHITRKDRICHIFRNTRLQTCNCLSLITAKCFNKSYRFNFIKSDENSTGGRDIRTKSVHIFVKICADIFHLSEDCSTC